MLRRTFATTARQSTRIPRTRDPLLTSENVKRYALATGEEFFIRRPPTVTPPTLPIATNAPIPPRPAQQEEPLPEKRRLTIEEVEEIQKLRRTDPVTWTRSAIAKKFGISTLDAGRAGFGASPEGKMAAKMRKQQVEKEFEQARERWGWKKQVAREERKRRRSMW